MAISGRGAVVSRETGGLLKSREKITWIFSGTVDLSAANGTVGTVLLDPENITIGANINIVSGDNDDQLGDNEILKGDKAVNENPLGTFNISAGSP